MQTGGLRLGEDAQLGIGRAFGTYQSVSELSHEVSELPPVRPWTGGRQSEDRALISASYGALATQALPIGWTWLHLAVPCGCIKLRGTK
jgi:hypothetical protein